MHFTLQKSKIAKVSKVQITGSKSESNRLLLLQALYPEFKLENVSNSDDSNLMTNALASEDTICLLYTSDAADDEYNGLWSGGGG